MTRLKDKFDDTAREKRRFVKCNGKSKRSKQAGEEGWAMDGHSVKAPALY